MMSTCPKCQAEIELDLPSVPDNGTRSACPACKAKLYVHKESFGARAFRKASQISCAACGDQLGHDTYCPRCRASYPDYFVVAQGTKPALLPDTEVKAGSFELPTPTKRLSLPQMSSGAKSGNDRSPQKITAVVALLVVVALGAGGFTYYKRLKAEKAFVESFVKLTYCIHVGQVRSKEAATKIATEWKANPQKSTPHIAVEEEKDLSILAAQIQGLQAKTATPPEKYRQSKDAVTALYASSKKMQDLAVSPSSSVTALTDTTARLDAEYHKTAGDFKSTLPEDLKTELQSASKRYKALQTLL